MYAAELDRSKDWPPSRNGREACRTEDSAGQYLIGHAAISVAGRIVSILVKGRSSAPEFVTPPKAPRPRVSAFLML